ncbi:hypothetical protein [Novosphingobium silvae]
MSAREHDPAAARFAMINGTRILGVACVVVGMLMASNRLFASTPDWIGYVLIVNGLIDAFLLPAIMVRKWRTPK